MQWPLKKKFLQTNCIVVAKAIAKVLGVNVERSGYIGEVELGSGGTIFFPGNVTTGDFTVITWAGNQLLEWKEDSFSWSLDKLPIIPSHFELTYSRVRCYFLLLCFNLNVLMLNRILRCGNNSRLSKDYYAMLTVCPLLYSSSVA